MYGNNQVQANQMSQLIPLLLLSEKENSPTHTAMRSSFYSMSMMGDSNIEAEDDNKEIARFQQEQATRGAVVNKVNFKNILELSQ